MPDHGAAFVYLKMRDLTTHGPLRFPGEARKIVPKPGVISWEIKDRRGRWIELPAEEIAEVQMELKK